MLTTLSRIVPMALFALTLPLSGCSQKSTALYDTFSVAAFGPQDIEKSADDINALPWASIYAKLDGDAQAFMVLGFAEPRHSVYQLKWLSANNEMVVTESGRLMKTVGLQNGNLLNSESNAIDPLQLGLHKDSTPTSWARSIDWQPGNHFGVTLTSSFAHKGIQTLIINEKPVETLYVVETVNVPELDIQFENEFWVSPQSGRVLSSKQAIAPTLPSIDITVLKPFSS
ncbi:lipoprotein YmcC precursor [Enterovibrio norvegicus]|uniref:YjbF family lipoprotein n=1 Tax=Enterovibrio norvegicus TaxID=188144 RepID=UPI0003180A60|nr:YjbF family lipoprotein [Enterovibrio norvegicus]OEE59728.1 lipoprotein YmcC precursor [Enterovibrio norvegicus]